MGKKNINYSISSIPQIKKSIVFSCLFSIFMIGIILLQIISYLYAKRIDVELEKIDKIVLITTCIFSIIFLIWQGARITLNIVLLNKIKKENNFVKSRIVFNFSTKKSFGHFIRLCSYILMTITSILAFGFGTYLVLKFIYADKMGFYLPLLFAILIANIYSCVNIDEEMNLNVV